MAYPAMMTMELIKFMLDKTRNPKISFVLYILASILVVSRTKDTQGMLHNVWNTSGCKGSKISSNIRATEAHILVIYIMNVFF